MLPLALCLIVVGGASVSEAATSATFFLQSGAQLLAVLLAFGLVALCVPQAEAFMALVLGVAAVCLGFCILSGREVANER